MAKANKRLSAALVGVALLALSACAEVVRNHGYMPSEDELSTISVGKDTRETVATKVGRPAAGGVMAESGWFYVQSQFVHRGPMAAEERDRQVVSISFAQNGTVSNVERFGLQDGKVIPLSRRVTESNIQGVGFIQQMLGNLGRIDPTQMLQQNQ